MLVSSHNSATLILHTSWRLLRSWGLTVTLVPDLCIALAPSDYDFSSWYARGFTQISVVLVDLGGTGLWAKTPLLLPLSHLGATRRRGATGYFSACYQFVAFCFNGRTWIHGGLICCYSFLCCTFMCSVGDAQFVCRWSKLMHVKATLSSHLDMFLFIWESSINPFTRWDRDPSHA